MHRRSKGGKSAKTKVKTGTVKADPVTSTQTRGETSRRPEGDGRGDLKAFMLSK